MFTKPVEVWNLSTDEISVNVPLQNLSLRYLISCIATSRAQEKNNLAARHTSPMIQNNKSIKLGRKEEFLFRVFSILVMWLVKYGCDLILSFSVLNSSMEQSWTKSLSLGSLVFTIWSLQGSYSFELFKFHDFPWLWHPPKCVLTQNAC